MIRTLRKHFLKLFIGTVVSTAILLFFALRSEYVADRAHHYLVAYLEDSLQSRVEMGRPQIAWLRGSWYIKNVSIRPDFTKDEKELLTARSVRISFFPWWNVFKMEIGVMSVQIEDPVIYLKVEKGNIANLPRLDFLKGSGGFFRFTLREIRIYNGRMDMDYHDKPMQLTFSNIGMRIRPDFYRKQYGFSLLDSSAIIKINDFTQVINSLNGEFDITPALLKIKNATLTAPEGKAFTDNFSMNFSTGKWNTGVSSTVNLAAIKELINGHWSKGGKTREYLKKSTTEGDADISATIKGDKKEFEVNGEAKSAEIELDKFKIRNTSFTFSTRGKWDSIKESQLDIELRSKVPVEIVNHYFESTPQLKGVADIRIKGSGAGSEGADPFRDIKIDGHIAASRIELDSLPVTNLSARFKTDMEKVEVSDMAAELLGGSLKGEFDLNLKETGAFKGSIKVGNIELNELSKQWSNGLYQALSSKVDGNISGNIDFDGGFTPEMSANVSSSLQCLGLSISNEKILSIKIPRTTVNSRFSYGGNLVRLTSLDIETPFSTLSVTGDIVDRQLSLGFKLVSSNLNELSGRMKGTAILKGRLSGGISSPEVSSALDIKKVWWDMYHADSIDGNLDFKESTVSSTGLSIRHGDSDLSLEGEMSLANGRPMFDIRVESKRGRLEDVLSMADSDLHAKGDISLIAKVKGAPKALDGEVVLKGTTMAMMGEEIDTLDIAFRMEKGKMLLQKGDLVRNGDRVSITGGTSSEGDLDMEVSSSPLLIRNLPFARTSKVPINGTVSLEGKITGSIRDPSFRGKSVFNGVGYRQMNFGNGDLDITVIDRVLTASGNLFAFDVKGNILLRENIPFNVSIGVKDAPMAPYFKGSDKLEGLKGDLTGEMEAHGELLNLKDVSAKLSVSRLQLVRDPFLLKNTKNIELELKNGRMGINSFQLSGKGTELNAAGWIWTDGETNLLITGSIDLYLLQLFTKVIEKGAGVAEVKLTINGRPPKIEGEIFIKDGVIGIKKFDPVFRDVTGDITLKGETLIIESAKGRIGEGEFKGGGTIVMDGLALKRTDITLDISGLYLAYPKWLPSEVEGTLRLSGDYPSLLISGDMNVVKARYSEKIDWGTFLPSFKQRLKKPETEKERIGAITMDINFKADRNLIFDNNVGKGELKGEVKLKLDSGRFGILGQVEVLSGKVFYKEHEFKITSGIIEFPDPKKMEAVFDFTGEGKVRDYIVQILVQGNTNDFKVTMTSSPALSELDIASLLSLGLTSKEFQESGGVVPAYGAASLLSREVESRFKDYIGFNRFHIDPYYSKITGTTEPKLTVGKDVSDDVMVIYSRGLTGTGEQEVQMEYKLYRNFSVLGGWSSFGQSQSGDLGADIKYRFEFR